MTEWQLINKIAEIKSYIASDWPGIEERKHLYQRLYRLEEQLKELNEQAKNKLQKDQET